MIEQVWFLLWEFVPADDTMCLVPMGRHRPSQALTDPLNQLARILMALTHVCTAEALTLSSCLRASHVRGENTIALIFLRAVKHPLAKTGKCLLPTFLIKHTFTGTILA